MSVIEIIWAYHHTFDALRKNLEAEIAHVLRLLLHVHDLELQVLNQIWNQES